MSAERAVSTDRRLDRRTFISFALGAGAAAGLAACTPTTPGAPAAPTSPPAGAGTAPSGGPTPAPRRLASTVNYGSLTISDTVDPHGTLSNSGFQAARMTYDALLTFDEKGEKIVGQLAQDYRLVDDRTIELRLREGIKFSNGEDFTAETVRWNFERIERSTDPLHLARKQTFGPIPPQVEVVNSTTVRIRIANPDPIFANRLTGYFMVSPRFTTERNGDLRDQGVGTGSYRITGFQTQRFIQYEAFEGTWRGSTPVKSVRFNAIPEAAALVSALQTGEIDIAYNPAPDQLAQLRPNFNISTGPAGSCTVGIIVPTFPPAADQRVRLAMNLAISKEQVLQAAFGGLGRVATGQLAQPGMLGYNENLRPYPHDPERARSLIQQSGHAGAPMVVGCTPALRTFAEALAGAWTGIGLRSTVNLMEFPLFVTSLTQRSEVPVLTSRTDYFSTRDIDSAYFGFSTRPGVQDRFTNPDWQRLFLEQRRELDPQRRGAILQRMAQIMHEEAACVPAVWQDFAWAHTKKIATLPIKWDTAVYVWEIQKEA